MKQAAILYALGHLGPRLRAVRKRTWVLAGLAIAAILAMFVWLAVALLSWGWSQLPAVAASGREAASATVERIGQAAPGLQAQLEPWLGKAGVTPSRKPGDWPLRDVSGVELPGIERPAGFVRTHYAREERRIELRYEGQGDFHDVLSHYATQFGQAGYAHEIVSATHESERHRFIKTSDAVDFEIRRAGKAGNIEVVIVDRIG